MRPPPTAGGQSPEKKRSATGKSAAGINSLDYDILCKVFSLLDIFGLARCSAVCKFWNKTIEKSELLREFCQKQYGKCAGNSSELSLNKKSWRFHLEELVMEQQTQSLTEGQADIHLWKGHSTGVSQCRMKMGLILTGVGDKVMRLWSVENYKCQGEHSVPKGFSLVDFDFDESKIAGLIGTPSRLCLWRSNGQFSFLSREGAFPKGLCMRYFDPEAVVGCEDGTVRVFDMYSKKCSRIIRMHHAPVTCLSLSEDQLIFSGSSSGSITVSGLSSDEPVATLRSTDLTGIKTLCFNPRSASVFSGSTAGFVSCFDIRKMRRLWESKVSTNVLYSLGHMQNDSSTLVVGGIDGVLRVLDQNTGNVLSSYAVDYTVQSTSSGMVEKRKGRRLSEDSDIDTIPRTARPQITSLAVGMKKVVTVHNGMNIRVWKFNI